MGFFWRSFSTKQTQKSAVTTLQVFDKPADSVEITAFNQQQISFLFIFQDRFDGWSHHKLRIFFDTYLHVDILIYILFPFLNN